MTVDNRFAPAQSVVARAVAAILLASGACGAMAGATTDGSVGAIQTLSGKFTVPQSLGTVAGSNLFHSFKNFSIGAAETATFTTTSATLANVISRVSGGQLSTLEGLLRLSPAAGSAPNFYLINPAGVTFGHGARVDVPAAFHVSTAHRINFADGSSWDSTSATLSSLSAAAPESFGFLGAQPPGSVSINNRVLATNQIFSQCDLVANCHQMQMKNGAYTSIVAGNIELEDSNLYTAGASTMRVVAAGAGTLTVPISASGTPSAAPTGSLSLLRSVIAAEDAPSTIVVHAGSINLGAEGEIYTFNQSGAAAGGSLDLRATHSITLSDGAEIAAATFSGGKAADISVQTGALTLSGGKAAVPPTGIISDSDGSGAAGNINIKVSGNMSILSGGIVSSSARKSGDAGAISINAADLSIDRLGNPVTMTTFANGTQLDRFSTGIFSDSSGSGRAGTIVVATSGTLSIKDGGAISTGTHGQGAGGTLSVSARNLLVSGQADSNLFSGITSQANAGSSGNAGLVSVAVSEQLNLRQSGAITSDTFATGAAGNVSVSAATVSVDGAGSANFTGISSAASNGSSGQTGNVSVAAAQSITLANTGQFSIRSTAQVASPDALKLSSLQVVAQQINLIDKGAITASATGNTNASRISLGASDSMRLNNATINTSAHDGNGGPISIVIGRLGWLTNSRITTSVDGANGNGGNITIDPPYLILQNGFIQANTAAPLASGGLVKVVADTLISSGGNLHVGGSAIRSFTPGLFGDNVIQAAAPTGINGVISLSTPMIDLTGSLAALNNTLVDYTSLLAADCQLSLGSSLSVMNRSGLPPSSFGPLRPEAMAYRERR